MTKAVKSHEDFLDREPPVDGKWVNKVIKFWHKKRKPFKCCRLVHKKKSKAATKKLRIQGKFVTFEQAVLMVGKREANKLLKNRK